MRRAAAASRRGRRRRRRRRRQPGREPPRQLCASRSHFHIKVTIVSREIADAFGRAGEAGRRAPWRVERRVESLLARETPTFLECPRVDLDGDLSGYDAIGLGLPFESVIVKDPRTFYPQGTAPPPGADIYARQGSYHAPAAIRRASIFFSLDHSGGWLPEHRLVLGEHVRLGDAGDLALRELAPQQALEQGAAAV